jgi:hypothetical protein
LRERRGRVQPAPGGLAEEVTHARSMLWLVAAQRGGGSTEPFVRAVKLE